MPSIAINSKYKVTEDFKNTVTLDFTAEEFRANGNSNGLPRECLAKREFCVTADCSAGVRDSTVNFKEGQKIKDTTLAYRLIEQQRPIVIRDTLLLKEGNELPFELGKALEEAKMPVERVEEPMIGDGGGDDEEGAEKAPELPEEPAKAAKKAVKK